jgi:mono/diheme cytochrome c family protein
VVIRAVCKVVASSVLSCFMASILFAQEKSATKVPAMTSDSPSGAGLFKKHCAVCHGDDLKGAGPFPAPYRMPPDLTTLTQRHGGKFPSAYVSKVLHSGVELPAHGPAEMPVWGTEFETTEQVDKAKVALRIKSLTTYIASLQVKKDAR